MKLASFVSHGHVNLGEKEKGGAMKITMVEMNIQQKKITRKLFDDNRLCAVIKLLSQYSVLPVTEASNGSPMILLATQD